MVCVVFVFQVNFTKFVQDHSKPRTFTSSSDITEQPHTGLEQTGVFVRAPLSALSFNGYMVTTVVSILISDFCFRCINSALFYLVLSCLITIYTT